MLRVPLVAVLFLFSTSVLVRSGAASASETGHAMAVFAGSAADFESNHSNNGGRSQEVPEASESTDFDNSDAVAESTVAQPSACPSRALFMTSVKASASLGRRIKRPPRLIL